jgi:hypothetical protein
MARARAAIWVAPALTILTACSRHDSTISGSDAAPASATADASTIGTATDSGVSAKEAPTELSPADLLGEHRRKLGEAAEQGKYVDVCKGAPWFNQVICLWAAARAEGKAVGRPDGELFRAFFNKEHWKHGGGTIIGDPTASGDLEVSANGYRNHCVLETNDTKFSSRGRWDLWVQEQPETREVTLNSGSTQNWVVLEEMALAKALMDLAHSGGGIEGTARAKDAMKMIAEYQTYAELKGEIPAVPGAPPMDAGTPAAPVASVAVTPSTPAPARPTSTVAAAVSAPAFPAFPTAGNAPPKNPRARADCLAGCVAKCADDTACERACAGKCPGS